MEEWQDPDSGYLNCIGLGDSYVRKQMERIANNSIIARFYDGTVVIKEKSMNYGKNSSTNNSSTP